LDGVVTVTEAPAGGTGVESIPDFAYTWRPYANEKMIYKDVERSGRTAVFAIDPWTRRWAVLDEVARLVMERADGKRRLSEIVRELSAAGVVSPCGSLVGLAVDLREHGLVFDTKAEHKASGVPVYNAAEPSGFHIEITNGCNMTCTHCYVSSGTRLPDEMSLEEILRTIDMLPPFSGKRIAISGGEPAVRKDCGEIVEYAAVTCGHDIDLYTNGKRFPEKLARQIVAINAQGLGQVRLQVSLEGADPGMNDLVRGPGSFAETMKSFEMFRSLGLHRSAVLFVCITKANFRQIDDIIRLAEQLDVGMLVFSQWQRQGNAADTPWAAISPSVEEWVAAGEKILAYDNPRLSIHGNFFGDLNNNDVGRFSLDAPLFPKHLYYYNVFPRISPTGEVLADQLWVDPDWILGNVREEQLEHCFERPKFHEQLEAMRRRVDAVPECQKCEWVELCQGGSPGHTYAEYGHMNAKDLFCESRIYWFERFVDHQVDQALTS
jgi:radical SAM protein with 4Fe4S-binding SPASM domain